MGGGELIGSDEAPHEELAALLGSLRDHLAAVEVQARSAARDAAAARAEVTLLRDEVAAAERDQQDLRAVRARLRRLSDRGLIARILNQDAADRTAPNRVHRFGSWGRGGR